MNFLKLRLALTFAGITIALTALESHSCFAQNTKTSPSIKEIDGNEIDSIELVRGDSKRVDYKQPVSKIQIDEPPKISLEFVSKSKFVVTGMKLGITQVTLHTSGQQPKLLTINVMPEMTRRPRNPLKGDKEQRNQKTENLIDSLANLDSQTIGIHWNSNSSAFIPNLLDTSTAEDSGNSPKHIQAMTKIIEMGEEAIPHLLKRLSDDTPTKLSIKPASYVMMRWHSDEYPNEKLFDPEVQKKHELFEGEYQVKIGDVCFVLIGQIVNKPYLAVRYQHSGCMVVNSPVHTPKLKQQAVTEWQNIDEAKLRASLLKDLQSKKPWTQKGAIARLDYYFPNMDDISDAASKQIPPN